MYVSHALFSETYAEGLLSFKFFLVKCQFLMLELRVMRVVPEKYNFFALDCLIQNISNYQPLC